MKLSFIILSLLVTTSAVAQAPRKGYTAEQSAKMVEHNAKILSQHIIDDLWSNGGVNAKALAQGARLPFAEYTETGYLIFNDGSDFSSWSAKTGMAANLPDGVTLVVFTGNSSAAYQKSLKQTFTQYLDSARVKILYVPQGNKGFWTRDAVPVPVWRADSTLTVIDARYYHEFEGDSYFADTFNAVLDKHSYYYEGGNFLANANGDCVVVNNERTQIMPDDLFAKRYGCGSLLRLPFIKGIGHVDESVKFINDTTVLTDSEKYRQLLQDKYKVVMLPRPEKTYETYVNSLMINGTVFLPVFGEKSDAVATKVYQDMGLKVVALNSKDLSNNGFGSIHCITMTYPPVAMKQLVNELGAVEVQ